jgi:hypothetical protein
MLGYKPLPQQPVRPDLFRLSSVRDCTRRLHEPGKALQKWLFFSQARMRRFRSSVLLWLSPAEARPCCRARSKRRHVLRFETLLGQIPADSQLHLVVRYGYAAGFSGCFLFHGVVVTDIFHCNLLKWSQNCGCFRAGAGSAVYDLSTARHVSPPFDNCRDPAYSTGREPVMRMSTSLLALCCQSGLVATLATPMRARSRSIGSRSLRMSPLLIARFTSSRIASQI